MKKFEYKILTFYVSDNQSIKSLETTLNQEGKEGWELITNSKDEYPDEPQTGEKFILIFKKEIHF
jgi:hypothetical protein